MYCQCLFLGEIANVDSSRYVYAVKYSKTEPLSDYDTIFSIVSILGL